MYPRSYKPQGGMTLWDWPEMSFFGPRMHPVGTSRRGEMEQVYAADMTELDDKVVVEFEMPGFSREQINVDIHRGRLHVSAARTPEELEGTPHVKERYFTRIDRSFGLPAEVDPSKSNAKLENGVLRIEMPKVESGSSRVEIT